MIYVLLCGIAIGFSWRELFELVRRIIEAWETDKPTQQLDLPLAKTYADGWPMGFARVEPDGKRCLACGYTECFCE